MKKKIFLLILLLVVCSGLVTYALFRSNVSGNANVDAARWNVVFKNGEETISNNFNISLNNATWTNPLGNVASGKIAPGSSATFYITLDATNTETDVDYTVELEDTFNETDFDVTLADDAGTINYSTTTGAMIKQIPIQVVWNGNINDNAEKNTGDLLKMARNITIPIKITAAQKLPLKYTVNFSVDGNTISTRKVNEGDTIGTLPENPTKLGYSFVGWYDDPLNGNVITSETLATSRMTIYAHFVKAYTVTFNSNGGSSVSPIQVEEGGTISSIPTSTKGAYTLVGWFDENDNKLTTSTIIYSNITYTAQWKYIIDVVQESTLGKNAYDGDLSTKVETKRVASDTGGSSIQYLKLSSSYVNKIINVSYSLNSKYSDSRFQMIFYDSNKNKISNAEYCIRMNNAKCDSYTILNTTPRNSDIYTVSVIIPNNAAYVGFMSLNTDAHGYIHDIYITDRKIVIVTFDSVGGSSVEPMEVYQEDTISTLPTSEKTDYYFMGWYDINNSELLTTTKIKNDITYYAKWLDNTRIPPYSDNTLGKNAYDGDLSTKVETKRTGSDSGDSNIMYIRLPEGTIGKTLNVSYSLNSSYSDSRFQMIFYNSSKQKISNAQYCIRMNNANCDSYTILNSTPKNSNVYTVSVTVPNNAVYLGFMSLTTNAHGYIHDIYLSD